MKKTFKLSALLLAATIMFSSCIGSFQLTNKVKSWNETVSSKFVNELIFIAFHIIVCNSLEFWGVGSGSIVKSGDTKIVKNSQGQDVEITAMENGYAITDGVTAMNLVFDEETNIWSAEYNNQTMQLVKLVDDNNAQLFLMNGDVMDITLDAQGVDAARQCMGNYYAMFK